MLIKTHIQILEKIKKRKKGIPDAYKIDESVIHTFLNFLDIFKKSNRMIQFSKGFEYARFFIEKFEFEEFIAKKSFDLSSDLHVRKYEFNLNSVRDILKQHRKISQTNFAPLPDPITISSSLQSALYFHYYNE